MIYGQTGDRTERERTYFDRFVDALTDSVDGGQRIKQYLVDGAFDSDAIRDDVGRYPDAQSSNLCGLAVDDEATTKKMAYFVNGRRCMLLIEAVYGVFIEWILCIQSL